MYLTGSDSSRSSKDQNSHHYFHRRAPAFVVTDARSWRLKDFQKYISRVFPAENLIPPNSAVREQKRCRGNLLCVTQSRWFSWTSSCQQNTRTHTCTQWYTFINNHSHSSIHRQICKAFPAPRFEDPKVKVRNQVRVGLMWKTDEQISSCCRKIGLRSNPPDYKGRAVTLSGGGAAAESVRVRLRSWRLDAAQHFPHTAWPSPVHRPVQTMTSRFSNVHFWINELRVPATWMRTRWLREEADLYAFRHKCHRRSQAVCAFWQKAAKCKLSKQA